MGSKKEGEFFFGCPDLDSVRVSASPLAIGNSYIAIRRGIVMGFRKGHLIPAAKQRLACKPQTS